jgi:Protein of unknown function (DUF2939)
MSRLAALAIAALTALAGCASTAGLSAAGDVHSLLVAVRDNDRAAFDAHVDRRALEAEIQAGMVERTRGANLGAGETSLGLLLSGPLSRAAGGVLIQPEVFRAVADYYGYRPETPIPGAFTLAAALSTLPDGRVCAKRGKGGPCLLTFADEGGTWRLVAFDIDTVMSGHGRGGAR